MTERNNNDHHEDAFADEEEGLEPMSLAARRKPCHVRFFCIVTSCMTLACVAVVVLVVPNYPFAPRGEKVPSEPIEWKVYNYSYSSSSQEQCPRTTVYPSYDGCPSTCRRPDGAELIEPLYFFGVTFSFGQTAAFNNGTLRPNQSAYKQGINFQCPLELVRNFVNAGQEYVSRFNKSDTESSSSAVILGRELHTTLSYICCLTQDEAYWARQIAKQWVMDSYPFDFRMGFNKVECVTPRRNTWGTMLIAAETTQYTLLKMNHQIRDLLIAHDIPIIVPREQQFLFHMSLASVLLDDAVPKDNINANDGTLQEDTEHVLGKQIQDFTDTISNKYGSSWIGGADEKMTVQHWPRVTDLTQHLPD